jgi:ABC-2 type transport system permease protein
MRTKLQAIVIIAIQHFRNIALTRAFAVSTVLGPLFIVAVSVLPGLIASDPFTIDGDTLVALVAPADPGLPARMQDQLDEQGGYVRLSVVDSAEAGRRLLIDEEVDGVLAVSADLASLTYLSTTETQYHIHQALRSAAGALWYRAKLERYGISEEVAADLRAQPSMRVSSVDAAGSESSDGGNPDDRIFLVVTLCMLLYMTILFYGQIIGRSVVLEKTSKTVELMMSSVNADELMLGKILGIGSAGIFQYLLWITAVLVLGTAADRLLGIGLPSGIGLGSFAVLLLFFILGFLLYSAFYSAIGAASRDEQQVGQLGMPLILFLIVPLMMFVPIAMNPHSSLAVGLSLFPMTAPLVMVMRSISAAIPWYQMALSAGILLGSIALVGAASARIFRTGILMTGKKASLKEILRWITR